MTEINRIKVTKEYKPDQGENLILLISGENETSNFNISEEIASYIADCIRKKEKIIQVTDYAKGINRWFVLVSKNVENQTKADEEARNLGFEIYRKLLEAKAEKATITSIPGTEKQAILLAEGLLLSSYTFNKYKTEKSENAGELKQVNLSDSIISEKEFIEFRNLVKAVFITRDLVNEPLSYLTAEKFSEEIDKIGKEAGFSVEILHKARIESLKMGGLLGVNKGSPNPPTFTILEYKPANHVNSKPFVLVGKGVVYDTGGISLKPAEGMEYMKCDMAGAAAVSGILYSIATNKLPIHVIGLIPSTENRPSGDAIVPGDILTISNGKTVEVINTDAEGRLILADALVYAEKYNPELVIDFATLTGSAIRAIGKEGMVMLGTASETVKGQLIQTGFEVYERIVEFPLWEEYGKMLKSDIADIKNLGPSEAGAITAGKFLEYFTSYPWVHFDIAGGAYLTSPDSYRGKNGTGIGVRLIYNFLKKQAE